MEIAKRKAEHKRHHAPIRTLWVLLVCILASVRSSEDCAAERAEERRACNPDRQLSSSEPQDTHSSSCVEIDLRSTLGPLELFICPGAEAGCQIQTQDGLSCFCDLASKGTNLGNQNNQSNSVCSSSTNNKRKKRKYSSSADSTDYVQAASKVAVCEAESTTDTEEQTAQTAESHAAASSCEQSAKEKTAAKASVASKADEAVQRRQTKGSSRNFFMKQINSSVRFGTAKSMAKSMAEIAKHLKNPAVPAISVVILDKCLTKLKKMDMKTRLFIPLMKELERAVRETDPSEHSKVLVFSHASQKDRYIEDIARANPELTQAPAGLVFVDIPSSFIELAVESIELNGLAIQIAKTKGSISPIKYTVSSITSSLSERVILAYLGIQADFAYSKKKEQYSSTENTLFSVITSCIFKDIVPADSVTKEPLATIDKYRVTKTNSIDLNQIHVPKPTINSLIAMESIKHLEISYSLWAIYRERLLFGGLDLDRLCIIMDSQECVKSRKKLKKTIAEEKELVLVLFRWLRKILASSNASASSLGINAGLVFEQEVRKWYRKNEYELFDKQTALTVDQVKSFLSDPNYLSRIKDSEHRIGNIIFSVAKVAGTPATSLHALEEGLQEG